MTYVRLLPANVQKSIEATFAKVLHQDSIQSIDLGINLMLLGCPHTIADSGVFLSSRDADVVMSPSLMPTKERLLEFCEKLKGSCRNLVDFHLNLTGNLVQLDDGYTPYLLDFEWTMDADNDGQWNLPTETPDARCTIPDTDVTKKKGKATYTVYQKEVDRLAQRVEERIVEIAVNSVQDSDSNDEEIPADRNTTDSDDDTDDNGTTDDEGDYSG